MRTKSSANLIPLGVTTYLSPELLDGLTDLLARVTYEGLAKANPAEFYKYIPSWANEADMF